MKSIQIALLLLLVWGFTKPHNKVIQVDIASLLNARPVTTLAGTKLVTWTKGIDGNGTGDGYLTMSAAAVNGDKNAHALPDNPLIPANENHPEVLLHYSNKNQKHNQALAVAGEGEFAIKTPLRMYSQIYLALTSAEGTSNLDCELVYSDGVDVKHYVVPDYYNNVAANDSNFTYLVTDLAKWGKNNNMTEQDHHNIHLLKIMTEKTRKLTQIRVKKAKAGYLVFWAATGVTR